MFGPRHRHGPIANIDFRGFRYVVVVCFALAHHPLLSMFGLQCLHRRLTASGEWRRPY